MNLTVDVPYNSMYFNQLYGAETFFKSLTVT